MPHFSRHGGFYSASLVTGPSSVLLRLRFAAGKSVLPAVTLLAADARYGNASDDEVAELIQQAVDEANKRFGSSFVVAEIQYQSDNDAKCLLIRRAAYVIVRRLVEGGDLGFVGAA